MKSFVGPAYLLLVVSVTPTLAQVSAPDSHLAGRAAWAALQGNTIVGTTNDGPYSDYFLPDGTAVHSDSEGREAGHWVWKDQTVCFEYPADPDEQVECRQVELQGTHGAFINSDGSRYPFDVLAGDPHRLR